jgi:Zn-dependent M28 family amino/carboxypeptidase
MTITAELSGSWPMAKTSRWSSTTSTTSTQGKISYNVVAEIPGSDKADEIVMLGGHLDSWHAATGATDNAAGSAVMMEAARLIQELGLKPRRTIRVAFWSGHLPHHATERPQIQAHNTRLYL